MRLLALLLAVSVLGFGCAAPSVALRQRIGMLAVDGNVKASTDGGGAASSADGLGFDRDGSVYMPQLEVEWGGSRLLVDVFESDHRGSGTAESDLELEPGQTINQGDRVESDLEVLLGSVSLTQDVIPGDTFDLGLGLGLGAFQYDALIEAPLSGSSIESDETFPVAFLAGRGVARFMAFSVEVDANALELSYDDDEVAYIDVDAALVWRFWDGPGFGEASIGFRSIRTDLAYSDQGGEVEADLTYEGGYLGLSVGL